jgi:hypothetical protein
MLIILLVILLLMSLGSLPTWPHSRNWGYYPSGGLGLVVVINPARFVTSRKNLRLSDEGIEGTPRQRQ